MSAGSRTQASAQAAEPVLLRIPVNRSLLKIEKERQAKLERRAGGERPKLRIVHENGVLLGGLRWPLLALEVRHNRADHHADRGHQSVQPAPLDPAQVFAQLDAGMRRGCRTTEFWLTIATWILPILGPYYRACRCHNRLPNSSQSPKIRRTGHTGEAMRPTLGSRRMGSIDQRGAVGPRAGYPGSTATLAVNLPNQIG
jgi:hypothetical protein